MGSEGHVRPSEPFTIGFTTIIGFNRLLTYGSSAHSLPSHFGILQKLKTVAGA
jgi:hypothetical protein